MPEEHVFDLLPGYALGSLDEDELSRIAGHLSGCATCRRELSAYLNAADQIALAIPQRTPPANLRAKILRRVERSAIQPIESASRAGPAAFFRKLFAPFAFQRPAYAWAIVAVLLVLLLGASNLALWSRVNTLQASNQALNQNIIALKATPPPGSGFSGRMRIVPMQATTSAPQAVGYLMVFKNETYGTLVVENTPTLQTGKQYQLWLIQNGKRTSGGVFSVNQDGYGTLQVAAGQPLDTFSGFGITIEPEGGSPGPTGAKVMGGSL